MWKRTLIFATLHAIAGAAFYVVLVSEGAAWAGGHKVLFWLFLPLLAGFVLNLAYASRQRPARPGQCLIVVVAAPLVCVILGGIQGLSLVHTSSALWTFSVSMIFESIFAYVSFIPSWVGLMIGMGLSNSGVEGARAEGAAGLSSEPADTAEGIGS